MFALEFDRDLSRRLAARFDDRPNITVIEDDALSVDLAALRRETDRPIRLIANLPYNISTVILQRLFDVTSVFSDCVLMFQREVVERITAEPATSDRGYLTVMTEAYFNVEYLFDVPPSAFQPQPKVWSSVARLTPKLAAPENPQAFRHIVGISFAQKRKTIFNNLRAVVPNAGELLVASEIDPGRRAETLTGDEWRRVVDAFTRLDPSQG
jgi:16S rRNA (adenine1518-N6/adenine1519-N6)-dimethyltransferase